MMNGSRIIEYINNAAPSLFEYEVENNILKISTPFHYPDGDEIELYIEDKKDYLILSDLSETYRYLFTYSMDINNSNRRKSIINNIVETQNIKFNNGTFFEF